MPAHLDAIDEFKKNHPPQQAHKTRRAQGVHGHVLSGAYLHLEAENVSKTVEWQKAQTERTEAFCQVGDGTEEGSGESKQALKQPYYNHTESVGNKVFWQYLIPAENRYELRTYDQDGNIRTLFNSADLDPQNHTELRKIQPSPDGSHVLCSFARNGNDKGFFRIMDVEKGTFISDKETPVYAVAGDKRGSMLSWVDDGKGVLYWDEGGYYQDISTPDAAPTREFSAPKNGMIRFPTVPDSKGGMSSNIYLRETHGTERHNALYIRLEKGVLLTLFDDGKSTFSPILEDEGRVLAYTTHNAPKGRIVSVDPFDSSPDKWQEIVPEQQDVLTEATAHEGKLCAHYLHNAASRVELFHSDGEHCATLPVAPLSSVYFPNKQIGTQLQWYETTPASSGNWRGYDVEKQEITQEHAPAYTLEDVVVEQLWATSKDGTRIPMTVVRGKDTVLDGTAATMMTGYGGFNTPQKQQLSEKAHDWVSKGGIFVQTNLRGGGEFGLEWYEAGRLENKQNVYDDFAACAEHLIQNGYTSSQRLGITGGSNGGLLTLATSLQRPDLFGAVLANVAVSDMAREKDWESDYGDRMNDKHAFATAMKYSPVHNIREGVQYPPILVTTGDGDDRVKPGLHSYKFVATMQEKSPETLCLLHVEPNAGHTGTRDPQREALEQAREVAFFEKSLGPVDQKKYKESLAEAETAVAAPVSEAKWSDKVRATPSSQQGIAF